ncbi:acyl-protein thioesterase 1 [Xylona heveae TC161]|uniref:Acyl-protein thioesterase 1 n=1 Tax=Xylona heveae (strain CBS 132557 / TC161) TaxID=1328760 RepID=A0A165FCZ6_XYLHT|nr:acyl-protein thioesterase 1 [Xylona heveae TC161]KZF20837.1 acyl-protein thioesterase 1 [Xylona heveae TC161]
MPGPSALVVPALKRHTATVIFAHGLGDSGAGWAGLAENWRRRGKFEEVSFVFPNAPDIPITVNWGMRMPGWYDITTFDELADAHDEPGILRSRSFFHSLIDKEVSEKGISSDRIVLGGFSQGGAMSIFAGVTSPRKLGGIVGLSSYLLMGNKIRDLVPSDNPNKDTPVFMAHGAEDELVKTRWGKKTADLLSEWGWKVDWKTYPGLAHSADPQEIDDLEAFLEKRLPPLGQQ